MFRIRNRCRSATERSSRSSSTASLSASEEPATGVQQSTGRRRTRRSWRIVLRLARLDRFDDRAVHAVCDLVRELDAHLLEAGRLEPGAILAARERAGDAAHVAPALYALVCAEPVLGDDVTDADATARLQHPCDLGQHRSLV